jgi:hypothetical protein
MRDQWRCDIYSDSKVTFSRLGDFLSLLLSLSLSRVEVGEFVIPRHLIDLSS